MSASSRSGVIIRVVFPTPSGPPIRARVATKALSSEYGEHFGAARDGRPRRQFRRSGRTYKTRTSGRETAGAAVWRPDFRTVAFAGH